MAINMANMAIKMATKNPENPKRNPNMAKMAIPRTPHKLRRLRDAQKRATVKCTLRLFAKIHQNN